MSIESPGPVTDQSGPAPALRPLRGLATAVGVLAAVAVASRLVILGYDWWRLGQLQDVLAGRASFLDYDGFSGLGTMLGAMAGFVLASMAVAVLVLVWVWRARSNAEVLSPVSHRLSKGWSVGCWVVPIANLVLPPRVLEDLWAASRPDGDPGSGSRWVWPIRAWWLATLTGMGIWMLGNVLITPPTVTYTMDGSIAEGGEQALDALRAVAVLNTVLTVAALVTLGFFVSTLLKISNWQAGRTPGPVPPGPSHE